MKGYRYLGGLLAACVCALSHHAAAASNAVSHLPAAERSSLQAAYSAARHAFHRLDDGTHTARSPGQGWMTRFDGRGFTACPEGAAWEWGLELRSYGYLGALQTVQGVVMGQAEGQRLSYARDARLEEWFINDTRGLEQGWTLRSRPPGSGSQALELHLRVRGGLNPSAQGTAASFADASGTTVLTYSGLKAWDAAGTPLAVHLSAGPESLTIHVQEKAALYPITIDPIAQTTYAKPFNTGAGDQFGSAVAIDQDTVAIGAPLEGSAAVGVNGDGTNDALAASGAVYIFVRTSAGWLQQAYLKAAVTDNSDAFGISVALSGDTLVVGAVGEDSAAKGVNGNAQDDAASASGAAYVFVRNGSQWYQQAYLKASNPGANDGFGSRVAISGNTVVVGASDEDSASTGVNGNQTDEAAEDSGAAYVFVRTGSTWKQQAYLKASNAEEDDNFACFVAISGHTILIGADSERSAATEVNGNQQDNTANQAGAAYVFVRTGSTWKQQAYLKASNAVGGDQFGAAVAVSGDTALVGASSEDSAADGVNGDQLDNTASGAGAAYVFTREGSTWTQQAYLKASNSEASDQFGRYLALSGDRALIAAFGEASNATGVNGNQANNTLVSSGAAYLFLRQGTQWKQQAYLKASNTGSGDQFGFAVGLTHQTAIIGGRSEASAGVGPAANPNDNTAANAGAAYLFQIGPIFTSLVKTGQSIGAGTDLAVGTPGVGAINQNDRVLFESTLLGKGSSGGKNRALLSNISINSGTDITLQLGTNLSFYDGLPNGTKVSRLLPPVSNRGGQAVLQATISGPGITSGNNRLLLVDNSSFVQLLRRTGKPLPELGNARAKGFVDVVQNRQFDLIGLGYQLTPSEVDGVDLTDDSGILLLENDGTTLGTLLREGQFITGVGGTFGQIPGRLATFAANTHFFIAKHVNGPVLDAVFSSNNDASTILKITTQGNAAPGTSNGELIGPILSLTSGSAVPLYRTTLSNSPITTNDALYLNATLVLRKGDDIGGGVKIARILRYWPGALGLFHVQLSGTGVNRTNNQALLIRQNNNTLRILMRTGLPAPGLGSNSIRIASLSAIEVTPVQGRYAILATLSGAPASANQALYFGNTQAGDDVNEPQLRLPQLFLRKGDRYGTASTVSEVIRSISLKPAADPLGAGGRGFGQAISDNGVIYCVLQGDRGTREALTLTP